MAGFQNRIVFSNGEKLQPSNAGDISDMQRLSTDISKVNHTGNPEGVVSANPSSTCHDPVSGDIYIKYTGTGNTGWLLSNPFPLNTLDLIDDFVSDTGTPWYLGDLGWNSSGPLSNYSTSDHPGIVDLSKFVGQPAYMILAASLGISNLGSFVLGGGRFSLNFVWKLDQLSDGTDTFQVAIGLLDYTTVINQTFSIIDGVYFQYSDSVNSGNWQIITTSASTSTTTNTSVPADTDWHNFGIICNAAGTSVSFTIDGAVVGTIATNIPTAIVCPAIFHVPSAGAPLVFDIDLFYSRLALTNSR